MQIFISDSSIDLVDALANLVGSHCEIILFNDLKTTEFNPHSYVFFDLETDKKLYSKSIKFFNKNKIDIKKVLIADHMSSIEIKKHQKSKEAANFYLKFPMNFDVLATILGIEVLDLNMPDELQGEIETIPSFDQADILQEIVIDDSLDLMPTAKVELSQNAKDISAKLDRLFSLSPFETSHKSSATDSTAQVTGILEEIILDEVMDEFEDITLLDPTPEEDHTIKIKYEPDQLFPEDDDLEYPDLDNNHEKELISEIASEMDDNFAAFTKDDNSEPEFDHESADSLLSFDSSEEILDMKDEDNRLDELDLDLDLSFDESEDDQVDLNLDVDLGNDLNLELGEMSLDLNNDESTFDLDDLDLGSDDYIVLGELEIDNLSDLSLDTDNSDLDIEEQSQSLNLNDQENELNLDDLDLNVDSDLVFDEDLSMSSDSNENLGSSLLDDNSAASLQFDSLDANIDLEHTSNDIIFDNQDNTSGGMTEPDLGLTKNTVADHEINQFDSSIHFGVNREKTKTQKNKLQDIGSQKEDAQGKADTLQSQLDELDDIMNDDSSVASSASKDKQFQDYQNDDLNDEQLIKLTETIKFLRMDRDQLESKLHEIEDGKLDERRNVELYKSQLEEKGIEIGIMSKRYTKQIEKLQRSLEDANKEKEILIEKNKLISAKIDQGQSKKEFDLSRIRKREIELENKLEMLKADTQIQLKTREDKIIELKRRIDTLEFDMSTIQNKESKNVVKRTHLEEKLDKVIDTLRVAIEDLETNDVSLENIEELSKRLKNSI